MNKLVLVFLSLFFLTLISGQIVSAQLGYSNPNIPKIVTPTPKVVSGGSAGSNVSSVASGDNCIFVSPNTGDVVVTFNTSCGAAGNVDSVTAGSNFLIISPTTGNVVVNINGTRFNETIANLGLLSGFNSTFNSTYASFAYNQSLAVYAMATLNQTISHFGTLIGFNNTFNITYQNSLYNHTAIVQGIFQGMFNSNLSAALPLTNRVTSNCANITGNGLCPTSNFESNNITAKNITSSGWIFGKNLLLSITGTAFFPDTTFTVATVDLSGGLVSIPLMRFTGGAGLTVGAIADGLYVIPQLATTSPRILLSKNQDATDVWVFENNNNTGDLQIFRQNPFAGGTIDGRVNVTGYNITSNHQTYNRTSATALDTVYLNNFDRPIQVKVTVQTATLGSDQAYVNLQHNSTQAALATAASVGVVQGSFLDSEAIMNWEGVITVQPTKSWRIQSNVAGSGSVTLQQAWVTVI